MRWLPWKRHGDGDGNGELAEAREVREEKEAGLVEAEDQWPEVRRIADELRHHREENRFSERIMRAVRGT